MMKGSFVTTVGDIHSRTPSHQKLRADPGGAWFWVGQAVILVPLFRFPLIFQELHTLEFLTYVWQPVVAGLVAMAAAYTAFVCFHRLRSAGLILAAIVYVLTYVVVLAFADRQLLADVGTIAGLARAE